VHVSSFLKLHNLRVYGVSGGDILSSASSYRIITGEKYGVSTCEADEIGNDPRHALNCKDGDDPLDVIRNQSGDGGNT